MTAIMITIQVAMATPPTIARRVDPLDFSGLSELAPLITSIVVVKAVTEVLRSPAWRTVTVKLYFPDFSKRCATR